MLIKFFVEAEESQTAIKVFEQSMDDINKYIKKYEVRNLTPYWKIENVYIIEVIIELYQAKLKHFLDFFSDTWMELGNPTDELLASKSNEGCTYIRNGFILINIFL